MASRTGQFVFAMAAGLLAGALFTAIPHSASAAPEDCLASPKGTAPEGQHWYYRIDRDTKRQCWYLREQTEKNTAQADKPRTAPVGASRVAQADAPAEVASPAAAARKTDGAVARSIEDAHAEFTATQARIDRDMTGSISRQPPAIQANQGNAPDGASSQNSSASQATSVSRWPDPSATLAPASQPAARPVSVADARPTTKSMSAPGTTAAALAVADASPLKPSGSIQTLLLVVAAALALAGIIASIVVRLGALHRTHKDIRSRRRVNWDAADEAKAPPWSSAEEKGEHRTLAADTGGQSSPPLDLDQPAEHAVESDVDQITALLEQMLREGPKLDRATAAVGSADYGRNRQDRSGVRA